MFKLFEFLFHTLPLILSWLYLLVAVFFVVAHIKHIKTKNEISVGQWVFSFLNAGYILFFMVTLIFFTELWELVFSVLGVLAVFVSIILSRYTDRRDGRRWWNW